MLSLSDECVLRGVREAFLPAHLHFLRSLTDVQSRQELQNQTPAMETRLRCVCVLALVILKGVSAVKVQNKLLGTCLQSHTGRVSLAECTPHSVGQEWNWFPEQQALVSQQNEECLTAPGGQYEGVQLKPCVFRAGADTNGAAEETEGLESQMWSCSKKGHLTLISSRLHLSASSQSTLVFLSREHKHGSKWRALDNQTLCSKRESVHHSSPLQPEGKPLEPRTYLSSASDVNKQAGSCRHLNASLLFMKLRQLNNCERSIT
ncbi:uncharacterized protein [Takifugu rubripes]|uniref:uncharacterized protein n=1 Tax=Takifugu rubripes TaxID=31033 RepID=UPI0011457795|nr:uncharacterized protein LOC105418078 [Takifugu rubripes]